MRTFLFVMCSMVAVGLAYWAYNENYKTQAKLKEIEAIRQEIIAERQKISVLKAEWAYLNRPDRLQSLVDLNFEDLELIPLNADHFGDATTLPERPAPEIEVNAPVSVVNIEGVVQ